MRDIGSDFSNGHLSLGPFAKRTKYFGVRLQTDPGIFVRALQQANNAKILSIGALQI